MITVGSCFAGIGGIDLGLEKTGGFKTKWQIEKDPYASAVLAKHWPDVSRFGDIKTVDVKSLERVDLICGGYPCQPFSLAGKRGGADDDRHLWPEMLRIIRGVGPRIVLLENVPGHLSMGFGRVLGDLAESGFDAEWDCIPASSVGAPHRRDRLFVVAYARGAKPYGISSIQREKIPQTWGGGEDVADTKGVRVGTGFRSDESGAERRGRSSDGGREVPNAKEPGLEGEVAKGVDTGKPGLPPECGGWSAKCRLGVASHGIPGGLDCGGWECGVPRVAKDQKNRVHRLTCLGNAVVPQVAEKVGEMILRRFQE